MLDFDVMRKDFKKNYFLAFCTNQIFKNSDLDKLYFTESKSFYLFIRITSNVEFL